MQKISKEILLTEIVQPISDEFRHRREACNGWYIYVILPVVVVTCGFVWIVTPSAALCATIGAGLIWIGLYCTSKSAITKEFRKEAYDCFIRMFPTDHPDFLKAIGTFISIPSKDEFVKHVQEQLIEESGKTPSELKMLALQRDYNSAKNILDGPVIPVGVTEPRNLTQPPKAQPPKETPVLNSTQNVDAPREDKFIKLDLEE